MIAFRLGPFSIAWYGIMITTGVIAATFLSYREAKRRGLDPEHVLRLVLFVLPLGMIGARIYHVIDLWSYYSQHPAQIFGGSGLGIFGAVLGGVIGLMIYTRWQKLSTLQWLDIVAPGMILAQAIGRWGNFFNQELYGYPTDLPWGLYIDPVHRVAGYENFERFHPLFFYEFTWNLLGCILLLLIGRKLQKRLLNGDIFCLYVIWYSIGRFYLEGLKIGVWELGGIPTARWITAIALIVSTAIIIYRHNRRRTKVSDSQ
ncbi:MAG: prolipoprotein diacylglyceryl transferase [Chloroflexi bacterium RBG_16_51_9]|nr:MAG: prolipoprotein diacylglyceryl transferase [Chloroflexi bacterium RBG_16_51_9]